MALTTIHKETTFGVGDTVRVYQFIQGKSEEEKGSRTQIFEGMVIGIQGSGMGKSFVVRRIGEQKIGIEQIFPLHSPIIDKVEVVRTGLKGTRHAKLYFTRDKSPREIEKIYSRAKRKDIASQPKKKKVVKKAVVKKRPSKKSSKKAKLVN